MQRHKYSHNIYAFNNIDIQSCYWAGFLAGDGSIALKSHTLSLALASKDIAQINKFKKYMRSNGRIEYGLSNQKYPFNRIRINGAYQVINDLKIKFNIIENKQTRLSAPPLKKEQDVCHYIRGLFDSDGSIYFNTYNKIYAIEFLGTKIIVNWIKNQILKYVPNIGNPSIRDRSKTKDSLYGISFDGRRIVPILHWIYNNSNADIRLKRKFLKYKSAIRFYNKPAKVRKHTSKFTGVSWKSKNKKWIAQIFYQNKKIYIGSFKSQYAAHNAYLNKKKALYGNS